MKFIWNHIANKNWKTKNKNYIFLFITTLLFSVIGFILWYALHFFTLNSITWAISFTGFSGYIIGLLGGIIYLYRLDT